MWSKVQKFWDWVQVSRILRYTKPKHILLQNVPFLDTLKHSSKHFWKLIFAMTFSSTSRCVYSLSALENRRPWRPWALETAGSRRLRGHVSNLGVGGHIALQHPTNVLALFRQGRKKPGTTCEGAVTGSPPRSPSSFSCRPWTVKTV